MNFFIVSQYAFVTNTVNPTLEWCGLTVSIIKTYTGIHLFPISLFGLYNICRYPISESMRYIHLNGNWIFKCECQSFSSSLPDKPKNTVCSSLNPVLSRCVEEKQHFTGWSPKLARFCFELQMNKIGVFAITVLLPPSSSIKAAKNMPIYRTRIFQLYFRASAFFNSFFISKRIICTILRYLKSISMVSKRLRKAMIWSDRYWNFFAASNTRPCEVLLIILGERLCPNKTAVRRLAQVCTRTQNVLDSLSSACR